MDEVRSALALWVRRLDRRTPLPPAAVDALLNLPGRIERVARHRDIVKQGEVTNEACLVASGTVGRFKQTRDGVRQLCALYIRGDMPDLHSVVLPRSRSALTALEDVTTYRVAHGDLRSLSHRHPLVAEALWRETTVDSAVAIEWVFVLGRLSALSKVAHLLCELSARYEAIGADPCRFSLHLTQEQIADATGLTAVHVNRMVRELREGSLIEVEGREVSILDRAGLAAVGEFDRDYLNLPDTSRPATAEQTSTILSSSFES